MKYRRCNPNSGIAVDSCKDYYSARCPRTCALALEMQRRAREECGGAQYSNINLNRLQEKQGQLEEAASTV